MQIDNIKNAPAFFLPYTLATHEQSIINKKKTQKNKQTKINPTF